MSFSLPFLNRRRTNTTRTREIVLKHDEITFYSSVVAIAILVFFLTLGGSLAIDALIAVAIGDSAELYAMVGQIFGYGRYYVVSHVRGSNTNQMLLWVTVELGIFATIAVTTPRVPFFFPKSPSALQGVIAGSGISVLNFLGPNTFYFVARKLFGVIMAIMEELLFRGLFGNILIKGYGSAIGMIGDSGMFALYHLGVYGGNPLALGIVFLDGIGITFVDIQNSGRISTGLIGHVIINLLSF
ncbi:MAG: CPBP family intramembrane metalloprotease [Patescibacteria group bacterium]|nr:CPBP family intramembrane metalloprotease [Patescibacteria group bacterium]